MRKHALAIAAFLLAAALLTACGADSGGETLGRIEKIFKTGKYDIPYKIVADGSQLTVTIASNISTGYDWTYEVANEAIIRCDVDEYVEDGVEIEDSKDEHHYVFTVEGDGEASLKFSYVRSWENDAAEILIIYITVQESVITEVDVSSPEAAR